MPPRNQQNDNPDAPAGEVVKPVLRERAPLPAQLEGKFTLSAWAESIANRVKYIEPDPDYLSRLLIVQTLTAASQDEVFEQRGIRKLQESVPNVPDAGTGPIIIDDLYIAASDQTDGLPCYMIMGTTHMETGEVAKYTTGAGQLQAQVLASIGFGTWPIPCNIKRIDRKDRGGRYLFWMYPPE